MKKIFVYGIAASMLFVGIISSCSKKDDSSSSTSSTASTASTTSTASTSSTTNPTPPANALTYDGVTTQFLQTSCNLDAGSSNIYTMYSNDGSSVESTIRFYGTPTAKTYNIVLQQQALTNADVVQLNVKIINNNYVAQSGTATVEIVSGKIVVKWSNIKFVKSGVPNEIISGDVRCD